MDSIFIFGLMLVLFGPKKLPEIARQAGKLMMEFRRASSDFKMQMEDELRAAEQAERQQKYEAETKAAMALTSVTTAPLAESTPALLPYGELAAAALRSSEQPVLIASDQPVLNPEPPSYIESDQPLSIQPPSVGETVFADPPNRMRDAHPIVDHEANGQVVSLPSLASQTTSAEEFYAQKQAELYPQINVPTPANSALSLETAQEAARKQAEAESFVTSRLPGTEMYPDTAPMAESEKAHTHDA